MFSFYCLPTCLIAKNAIDFFGPKSIPDILKSASINADKKLIDFDNGELMEFRLDNKFFKNKPFLLLSIPGLVMVATCAYFGYKVSGIGGALFGAFIGLTLCGC
jgi:hypothetical protein